MIWKKVTIVSPNRGVGFFLRLFHFTRTKSASHWLANISSKPVAGYLPVVMDCCMIQYNVGDHFRGIFFPWCDTGGQSL